VNEDGAKALDRLVSAYRAGRALVLLFDYDGTLTPIVEHPRLAVLSPERRRQLERLSRVPRIAVGVLSGRSLADVTALVDIPGLYYAGTGGMEIDLRGRKLHHPEERQVAALIDAVEEQLRNVLCRWSGAWVEKKPVGLTVHYRAVPANQTEELIRTVDRSLARWGTRLTTVSGPMAIEVLPANGWTKGVAVQFILDHVGQDTALPVYAGDEANDAEAFGCVATRGGVTIGVGPQAPPEATYRLSGPGEVAELLAMLLDSLAASPRFSSHAAKPG